MAGNVWEWVGDPYAPVEDGYHVLRQDMAYRLQGDPNVPTMSATAGVRCAADEVTVVETVGQPVTQFSDLDYTGGEVGFFVETFDESMAHIHYDTLTIREVKFESL